MRAGVSLGFDEYHAVVRSVNGVFGSLTFLDRPTLFRRGKTALILFLSLSDPALAPLKTAMSAITCSASSAINLHASAIVLGSESAGNQQNACNDAFAQHCGRAEQ